MTTIQLTRGQILEVMALLADAADTAYDADDIQICNNYERIHKQFDALNEVIAKRASERQLATLVLAEFTNDDI